jgi:signal transduction histidine kinase
LAREERLLRESIEQLRETEQKLVHSEKMRAIAGVAAGLLHEINNPVNYSMMALKVLRKQLRRGVDVDETLEDVEAGVSRIGEIVSDLQSFAHPDQLTVKSPFLLRDAALSAIRFLTHELPQDRVLIDEASEVGATVYGAQTQIVQVLLNLILNAEKAIRALRENSEGSSSAATRDRETDAWRSQRITIRAVSKDSRLIVSVIDNGIGMDESQLKLVRQPFFTTRSGEGLGLGLGICETIVQSHGGQLVIESELGKGTEVSFDLPLQASTEPDQRSSLTDSQTAPRPSSQSPGTFSA